jgi:hypothetical protein
MLRFQIDLFEYNRIGLRWRGIGLAKNIARDVHIATL